MRTIRTETLDLNGTPVTLSWKTGVRTLRLRIIPPDGQVLATAPAHMPRTEVMRFLLSRQDWMRNAISTIRSNPHAKTPTYSDGDTIYIFGKPYLLHVKESANAKTNIDIKEGAVYMTVQPQHTPLYRQALLQAVLKPHLQVIIDNYMLQYCRQMHCRPIPYRLLRRHSVWGTYHPLTHHIIFNLHLMHVSPDLIQYVVLHEMTHQYVAAHNKDFYRRMAALMPDWLDRRRALRQFARKYHTPL